MLCFVVVMQSFIMNSHDVFIHIHQGCFAGTGAIVRLPQCQWSKPDEYGKISQCITTTKHSKAKTVCIFLGIYCKFRISQYLTTKSNQNTIQFLSISPRSKTWKHCWMNTRFERKWKHDILSKTSSAKWRHKSVKWYKYSTLLIVCWKTKRFSS